MQPRFQYTKTDIKNARLGVLDTKHGAVETPAFIFCATKGAIKCLDMQQMKDASTQIILSNTYHMMLKPGGKYVDQMGGLQKFTGWQGPMLTDSGGFQAFSLNANQSFNTAELKRKYHGAKPKTGIIDISEEGILCKSYYEGDKFFLSPERSMKEQILLGADLIVVLDECTQFSDDLDFNKKALERNNRWAKRSLVYANQYKKDWQGVYGIIHGGIFQDLREQSAKFNNENDFFGFAIGGSLGRDKKEMHDVVQCSVANLTEKRPIHLLGVGGIRDIFMGVEMGVDTFDCVYPTRIARHGGAFVRQAQESDKEYINLRNSKFKYSNLAIEEDCKCTTCKNYSKGYLHYLLLAKESVASSLIAYHNVFFVNKLMTEIRRSLKTENEFFKVKKDYIDF